MNKLLKNILDYDLIGIGEHVHGEMTSWKFRYKIIKYLTKYTDKVYILCEQLDFFVNNFNKKNIKFTFTKDGFYPFITHNGNMTKEHLYYTKKIYNLPKIKFYGIDIQIVKFPELYKNIDKDLKNIIEKYKKIYLDNPSGGNRNECNANIINDLIKFINTNNKKNKFIYIAHNEHIALNCNTSRKEGIYKTEGFYLKNILNLKYLSIATYALNLYSIWHCNEIMNCKIEIIKNKSKKWNYLFSSNKNSPIIIKNDFPLKLNMSVYNNKDFDYVICEYFSDKMTLRIF